MKSFQTVTAALWMMAALVGCGPDEEVPVGRSQSVVAALESGAEKSTTYSLTCYEVDPTCTGCVGDQDGDGYVEDGNYVAHTFQLPKSQRLTCPDGWVAGRGDCDDSRSWVHPGRLEIAKNNRDDNCNGAVDEYEYFYSNQGYYNTGSYYYMLVKINDSVTEAYAQDGTPLYVRVEYGRLADHPNTVTTGYKRVIPFVYHHSTEGDFWAVYVPVTGLSAATVYRSRVESFYKKLEAEAADQVIRADGQRSGKGRFSFVRYQRISSGNNPLDNNWGWYYTTTTSGSVGRARTEILFNAFKQHFNQLRGRVGLLGDTWINGTHYGASTNEYWCSEFYVWCADYALSGIAGRDTVADLVNYFDPPSGPDYLYSVNRFSDLFGAERADWLRLSDGNHTGMLLAVDGTRVWTIEGNSYNEELGQSHSVSIRRRSYLNLGVTHYGHIASVHLD